MKRWDGAAYVDLTVAKRWDGTAWVNLTVAKRWDGTAWVDIPLPGGGGGSSLAISGPTTISRLESGTEPTRQLTTDPVNLTTTGGTAPYTYSWVRMSGSSAIQAVSPTVEDTQFTVLAQQNRTYISVFRCTVTDDLGATAFHDVEVTMLYESPE